MEDRHPNRQFDKTGQADNEPLVSVIIPTYNYGRFLGKNLDSVLSQSYRRLEVIVINDGSTDETLEVIKQFESDPRLKCFTQENQGCIKAMNRGFELSKADYLAFCGSDDVWNREHVEVLMAAFGKQPQAGMIFDNAAYFHNEGKDAEDHLVVPEKTAKDLALRPVTLQEIFLYNWITNCTFIVRRNVLDRLGLFDPDIYMTADLHLLYRIAAHYPVCFVGYVGARIRIHGQNMSVRAKHYEYGVRCLEDIRERYPEIMQKIGKRLFVKKLGRKYFRLGRYYERLGEVDRARDSYKKAFLTRKSRPRYYWNYIRLNWRQMLRASATRLG